MTETEFEQGEQSDEQSVEQMAEEEQYEESSGQLLLEGTRPTLTSAPGGRRPDVSYLRLAAVSLPVAGQFEKDERLRFLVEVQVDGVAFRNETKEGEIARVRRDHIATPLHVEPLD